MCMWGCGAVLKELSHLDSSRTPETSQGFHDCFPQRARQSTADSVQENWTEAGPWSSSANIYMVELHRQMCCTVMDWDRRIQWTRGRLMYTDSAMVSCSPSSVGLLWSFSLRLLLPLFLWVGAPQRRACRDGPATTLTNKSAKQLLAYHSALL